MSTKTNRLLIAALPFLMFLIFAGFWSALDVIHGLWLAIAPSAVVGLAIVAKVVLSRRRDES